MYIEAADATAASTVVSSEAVLHAAAAMYIAAPEAAPQSVDIEKLGFLFLVGFRLANLHLYCMSLLAFAALVQQTATCHGR